MKGVADSHPLLLRLLLPGFQRSSHSLRSVHTAPQSSSSFLAVAVLASFVPHLALILGTDVQTAG
jgi:hypothetical protein